MGLGIEAGAGALAIIMYLLVYGVMSIVGGFLLAIGLTFGFGFMGVL